jgi:hypothetical protein
LKIENLCLSVSFLVDTDVTQPVVLHRLLSLDVLASEPNQFSPGLRFVVVITLVKLDLKWDNSSFIELRVLCNSKCCL